MLVSSGYMTNLAVGQAFAGEFTHALIDERAHGCLQDAARLLGCPVRPFKHRDVSSAARKIEGCGRDARLLLLTDGLFSHSGEVAPLDEYLKLLSPQSRLLVDDAHSAGVLGRHGRGTMEHLQLKDERVIQTVTLSKAFGVYGGAVLGTAAVRSRVTARSRLFVGNTPLPLPLAVAAMTALSLVSKDRALRARLASKSSRIRGVLQAHGLVSKESIGPIFPVIPQNPAEAARLKKSLFEARIFPPLINYLGGPRDAYFRFAISSEHTDSQIDDLLAVLEAFGRTR